MRPGLLWLSLVLLLGCAPPAPVTVPADGHLEKQSAGMTHKLTANVPEVGPVLYSVNVAENYDDTTPAPLILLLHYGYEGSKPEAHTGAGMIDAFGSTISALEGVAIAPDVVGGDWRNPRNETAAVWLVKSAMATYNIDPKKVIIAGYSMGGEGTWFIGSRHQDLFTAAVPIAAPVAGGKDWKIPVHVIHSSDDQIVPFNSAKRHADAVKAAGGNVTFTNAVGLSHYDTGSYRLYFGPAIEVIKARWTP